MRTQNEERELLNGLNRSPRRRRVALALVGVAVVLAGAVGLSLRASATNVRMHDGTWQLSDNDLVVTRLAGSTPQPVYVDATGTFQASGLFGVVNLYYVESVGWSGSLNGGLGFTSDNTGNLSDRPEFPINYVASQATLTCNLATNNIASGGSILFTLTRNSTVSGSNFFTWTNSSATGRYIATISTGSTSAFDTYSLHFQTGGSAASPTRFACQLAFS